MQLTQVDSYTQIKEPALREQLTIWRRTTVLDTIKILRRKPVMECSKATIQDLDKRHFVY